MLYGMTSSSLSPEISEGISSVPPPFAEPKRRPKATEAARLILLVEDDFILRSALSELLHDEGYVVESAANGFEALRRVLQPPRPALVLLDIMMPHMDGLTFRATQLALPSVAEIPVIVISAIGPGGAAGLAFARVFSKPIDTVGLLAAIREIVEPAS
jgi:CheY-like chemotaxis protein